MQDDLDAGQSAAVAAKVREELARRRLSRQWLADEAKISISTLEKALAGRRPFTLATAVRLEEALGLKLREARSGGAAGSTGTAPEELGAYARPAVRWLEGDYLTLRPSINEPGAVYSYRTTIRWDDNDCLLRFTEAARLDTDHTQEGVVSFPHLSGHIYLITNVAGQYRIVLLGRPTIQGAMCGVLTTLIVGTSGSQLLPAASPIILVPIKGDEPVFGLIRPGMDCYEEYRDRVAQISSKGFAAFPSLATG